MLGMETEVKTSPHRRERAVNRRVQGDIGEMSAMEWLGAKGATVWVPFNHSPHVDLMAEWDDALIRVQVKTSTFRGLTKSDKERWQIAIATSGGNRSWTGLTKKFDPVKVDYLFVLVGDGRRWFIPAAFVEAARALAAVNTIAGATPLPGECQSGQMVSTVNRAAMPTQVRILPPPSTTTSRQILLRPKRQATFPKAPCEEAGIAAGDRLRVKVDGPGRLLFEKIGDKPPV